MKKGITSPSRGLSQHRSHTQDVRRGKKKKCLSCSLPRYSLFSTSGFKQPTRGSSPQPPTAPSPSAPESVSPLFDETQNYSSPCKVTSSQHAKCRWGEKERRERRTAERMREERYSTHRRPSGEKHAQLGALTGSQLRRLASKKQETLGGGVKALRRRDGSDLTYDGSQPENVRQAAVHRFIRGVLQEIITCEEDRQMLQIDR